MKLFTVAAALLALPWALAQSGLFNTTVSFDTFYDDGTQSLNTVACSNGLNGLEPDFMTFGRLPGFPNIGGAPNITGFDSPLCGSCWELTFHNTSINVLAIDTGSKGFNIALQAMKNLTSRAQDLGRISVTARMVGMMDACEEASKKPKNGHGPGSGQE